MRYDKEGQMNFIAQMADRQIVASEFFGSVLLESLSKNFDLEKLLITFFDTNGCFLSWDSYDSAKDQHQIDLNDIFGKEDIIRQRIYTDAVRDHLTYYNIVPRLYKSTDLYDSKDYDQSDYVKEITKRFQAHYSVTMAFGVNAYIQLSYFKSKEDGDFTAQEMTTLSDIYVYVATAYKNFKRHECAKIVSKIQSKIISSGERAYLITDQFMHVISHNSLAKAYLKQIWGPDISQDINSEMPCAWLPFLLGRVELDDDNTAKTRVIQNYSFKIFVYDKCYTNGIVDRYHWITITENDLLDCRELTAKLETLTSQEKRVAELMCSGLTYQGIADELIISYHTVKKHVQNIYIKCGVKSRHQLYRCFDDTKSKATKTISSTNGSHPQS